MKKSKSVANFPGPGQYTFQQYTGNEGIKYTFYKEKRGTSRNEKLVKSPSVGQYIQNIQYSPEPAGIWTFTKSPKFSEETSKINMDKGLTASNEIRRKRRNFVLPGPDTYSPNYLLSSTQRCFPSYKIGNGQRFEKTSVGTTEKVGPGTYNQDVDLVGNGIKYTISTRHPPKGKVYRINVPGPGTYETVTVTRQNEPKYSIGKEARSPANKSKIDDNYPGPGQYNIIDAQTGVIISFPKSKKKKDNILNTPGPGAYKIPCSFNDISDTTREGGGWNPQYKYV